MVKKTEKKENNEDVIFKTWAQSNAAFSKVWEDSYLKIYRPWIESTGEMFEKTANISEATPEKYKEFYEEWVKTYKNSFGNLNDITSPISNKEILESFVSSSKNCNKLFMSWIEELEDNSRQTKEILSGGPDPAKYKECHDKWVRSYEKIFNELMDFPLQEGTKYIFGKYMKIPDIYFGELFAMSKLFNKSYAQLCKPLNESLMTLSDKMAEISGGDAGPEAYMEFYNLWITSYKDTYGKFARYGETNREFFDDFAESANFYMSMYKSWIAALEKMSEKALEMSLQNSDPDTFKEFNTLWLKAYEKASNSFFEDLPAASGPMKEVMEPVKTIAKMYADTFIKMSKMWVQSVSDPATAYPGKDKK